MRWQGSIVTVALAAAACAPPEPPPDDDAVALAQVVARPASAANASPRDVTLRIVVAGDVLPHRPMLDAPDRIAAALAPLGATLFAHADAVVANYETATGDPALLADRPMMLAAPPPWMRALRAAGITSLTIANNHACDLGAAGLVTTLATARDAGVVAAGGDADAEPFTSRVIAERDGKRVCAVAWTTFVNGGPAACGSAKDRVAIAPLDRHGTAKVRDAVLRARGSGSCDAVIAIFHGGVEYAATPAVVRAQARAAAEAGADVVVAHHPHVPAPLETLRTNDGRAVPFFASLGNLVSNQGESWTPALPATQRDRHVVYANAWTRLGMIADVSIAWDATGKHRVTATPHLVWTDNDHASDRANPTPAIATRPFDPDEDEGDASVLARLLADRRGPRAVLGVKPAPTERARVSQTARTPRR